MQGGEGGSEGVVVAEEGNAVEEEREVEGREVVVRVAVARAVVATVVGVMAVVEGKGEGASRPFGPPQCSPKRS